VGLRPLSSWDRGFESYRVDGCLSLVLLMLPVVGRGLCDRLITRPEESYRVWECVSVSECDLETSTMRQSRTVKRFLYI